MTGLYSLPAQNTNLSNGFFFDGEPYIAINPNNSNHLVVAWMSYKFGQNIVINTTVSFDRGQTWSNPVFIPHAASNNTSADVSLDFNNNNEVFLCFIDYNSNFSSGSVVVSKSTDGGLSWNTPVEAININDDPGRYPIDRPWIAIDKSSKPSNGTIYVTSTNPNEPIVNSPYHPYIAVSKDNAASFSSPRYIDTLGWEAGSIINQPMPFPAVTKNGILYAPFASWKFGQNNNIPQVILATSYNQGISFNYNKLMDITTQNTDSFAKASAMFKPNPADSNNLGLFYILETNGDMDVFMVETNDGGLSWSSPVRINDDVVSNGIMQDLAWADYDYDGDLAVCWRDRRNSGQPGYKVPTEIYCSVRPKSTATFSANFPVSSAVASHESVLEGNGNDFMCVELVNDTIYAVWGDVRTGKLAIWLSITPVNTLIADIKEIHSESTNKQLTYPNPVTDKLYIKTNAGINYFSIYDTSGKLITESKLQGDYIDFSNYQKGNYIVTLSTKQGIVSIERVLKH
ncbi:MAG: hypothetical protein Kow0079_14550 [Vicingaceae bacterium]